ncbi:MAG TPA: MlaD family protein [Gemmatimonadaceae bacterium]|nr:MlaD family protein [Gemmatimonadaceae bacterium]
MPRTLRWRDLVVGSAVVGVLVITSAATFKYARIGRVTGETVRYYTAFPAARDVMGGTDVLINGAKVGRVSRVRFAPVATDTLHRVVVELEVQKKHRDQIRENSVARLNTGAKVMGPMVVYITAGTSDARVIPANDTIPAASGGDVQELTASFGEVTRELPAIMANVKVLSSSLSSTRGTIGALTTLDAPKRIEALVGNASRLTERATAGQGTIGLAMRRGELIARAKAATAQADSLRQLLTSERSTLGRFRKDSTLMRTVADVRDELAITSALLNANDGSLGRFSQDSIIAVQLTEMSKQLTELVADMKKRPLRYIAF